MAGAKRGGGGVGRQVQKRRKREGNACYILGYLKDSNAVAHSVDTDISKAVIHLLV